MIPKVLVICNEFPPETGSGVDMHLSILEGLAMTAHVVVITGNGSRRASPETPHTTSRASLNVVRLPDGFVRRIRRLVLSVVQARGKRRPVADARIASGRDRGFLKNLKKSLLVPDSYVEFIPEVRRWVGNTKGWSFDLVVGIANPYSDLLAALSSSQQLGIPLVSVYSDPWTLEETAHRNPIRATLERRLEEGVLRGSQRVVFCTEATRAAHMKAFPFLSQSRTRVCRFGYDPQLFDSMIAPTTRDCLTLVYGGRIVPGQRDVTPLLDALQSGRLGVPVHLDIYPVGSEDYVAHEVAKRGLDEVVTVMPLVTSRVFQSQLRRYDLLVLLGNSSALQIPAKVYQYLGSRRPILLVRFGGYRGEETEQLVSRALGSQIVDGYSPAIVTALHRAWRQKLDGLLIDTPESAVSDLSWRSQSLRWSEAILGLPENGCE